MRRDVQGHRAEKHLPNPAMAERTDHGQARSPARIDQSGSRIGSCQRCADFQAGVTRGDVLNDTSKQDLALILHQLDLVCGIPERRVTDCRQVRRVHDVDALVALDCLIGCPPSGRQRLP